MSGEESCNTSMNLLDLPDETLLNIMEELSKDEATILGATCRRFNAISGDRTLYLLPHLALNYRQPTAKTAEVYSDRMTISSSCVLPDGRYVIGVGETGLIKIFNTKKQPGMRCVEVVVAAEEGVSIDVLAALGNGYFVSSDTRGFIKVWNSNHPLGTKCIAFLNSPPINPRVHSFVCLSDNRLAAISRDFVNIWDLANPEEPVFVATLEANVVSHQYITSAVQLPDGYLAVFHCCEGHRGSTVTWDLTDTSKPVSVLETFLVTRQAILVSKNLLACHVSEFDPGMPAWGPEPGPDAIPERTLQRILLSNPQTGRMVLTLIMNCVNWQFAKLPNGNIVIGRDNGIVEMFDVEKQELTSICRTTLTGKLVDIKALPDGSLMMRSNHQMTHQSFKRLHVSVVPHTLFRVPPTSSEMDEQIAGQRVHLTT